MKTFLTPEDIEKVIETEEYHLNGRMTICTLTLKNGAKVVGINYGSIDPSRHSESMGREEARKQAVEKIWELEGYLLRQRLFETKCIEQNVLPSLQSRILPPGILIDLIGSSENQEKLDPGRFVLTRLYFQRGDKIKSFSEVDLDLVLLRGSEHYSGIQFVNVEVDFVGERYKVFVHFKTYLDIELGIFNLAVIECSAEEPELNINVTGYSLGYK